MGRKKKSDDALSLVDQLLSNEDPAPKKKKRGRPKGSKNKKTKAPAAKKTVATRPTKKTAASVSKIPEVQFVTEEEFIALGEPKWGYTTARIRQWKNRVDGYFEVYLEYVRAAILWSKLAKTIEWYSETSEGKLKKCRLEIEDFRKAQGLTKHDFWEVIALSHNFGHSRKKMLKELRTIAKIVVENRRKVLDDEKEKNKVNFREVAKIPPNVRPALSHVVIHVPAVDLEAADSPQMTNEHACPEHLTYRGLRKPRNMCPTCMYFYKHNKSLGLKETRNRNA